MPEEQPWVPSSEALEQLKKDLTEALAADGRIQYLVAQPAEGYWVEVTARDDGHKMHINLAQIPVIEQAQGGSGSYVHLYGSFSAGIGLYIKESPDELFC